MWPRFSLNSPCLNYEPIQVELHVESLTPNSLHYPQGIFTPSPLSDSLTFLIRVVRDHVDPHVWGTGSTLLLSNTSPKAFPCSGKVVNPGQETLPDSNCLELNTIRLICPQISVYETVYNPEILRIQTRTVREKKQQIPSVELNDQIDLQLNKLKTRKDDIYGPQSVSYTT